MSGISKLIIKAYGDDAFSSEKGEFDASINPANLKITSSLDYMASQAMGGNSLALRYNVTPPRVLSFKLLFDNTGIFPDSSTAVKDQLDSLQSIIYNVQDDIKEPYYVRVIWGTIDFKGKLVGMETSYTLFQADGTPSRAEADMLILEQVSPTGAAKSQQAQSSSSSSSSNSSTDNSSSSSSGSNSSSNGSSDSSAANASSNANNSSSSSTSNDNSNDASNGSNAASDSSSANSGTDDANNQAGDGSSDANNDASSADNQNNDNPNSEAANNEAANNSEQSPSDEANNQEAANEENNTPDSSNTATQEVQQGDTLPAVANQSLGDSNLAKDLGKLNALDSLRDLAAGLKLHIPSLGVAALLAALIAMAKKYAKEGANYIKKKAKAGEQKAVQLKNKAKSKV